MCFECFFAPQEGHGYWEVNLSPGGDWNVYAFDDYRLGMREEAAIPSLTVQGSRVGDVLTVSVAVPLPLAAATTALKVGLSAVIKDKAGGTGYWALVHPAEQPDFHDRHGFIVAL